MTEVGFGGTLNSLHIMKEFVGLDVFNDELDRTNAAQHCNNREPYNYCKVENLNSNMKLDVLGLSFGFKIS